MTKEKEVALIDQSPQGNQTITVFQNEATFVAAQRMAKILCASNLVPKEYQDNLPNAIIALEMAQRIGASPLAVMQNTYIVHGKPTWSSQFIIAAINSCGRFSPLRFSITDPKPEMTAEGTIYEWDNQARKKLPKTVKEEIKDRTCIAWAYDKQTGDKLEGPPVSIEMAVQEGWYSKDGSKWKTMPELMLRYRAATFFGRLYSPDVLMGMQTKDELDDITTTPEKSLRKKTDENANKGPVIDLTEDIASAGKKAQEDDSPQGEPVGAGLKAEQKLNSAPPTEDQTNKDTFSLDHAEKEEGTVPCPNREGVDMRISFCNKPDPCQNRVGCPAFAEADGGHTETEERKPGF